MQSKVSIIYNEKCNQYPSIAPFNPPQIYPEYLWGTDVDKTNFIYEMVRESFISLDLDKENVNSKEWNPLKNIVKPNDTVVIKPNWVLHEHINGYNESFSTITNGSIIRPVLDYTIYALSGKGHIIICDIPVERADFHDIINKTQILDVVKIYRKMSDLKVEIMDLRNYQTYVIANGIFEKRKLDGDPLGYTVIDLKNDSEFCEFDSKPQNYLTLADHSVDHFNPHSKLKGKTNEFHYKGSHQYLISNTILNSDAVIVVPKLKTHKKAGVTLSLKNIIGIVPDKNYMPHHRAGMPPLGDSYPICPPKKYIIIRKLKRWINKSLYRVIREDQKLVANIIKIKKKLPKRSFIIPIEWGNWYGNDTIWRTIVDLNKIVLYADKKGKLKENKKRKYLSIIDGIIGQEGDGPMSGKSIVSSSIIVGDDGIAVDAIAAQFMGFDPQKIKSISKAMKLRKFKIGVSGLDKINVITKFKGKPKLNFLPPPGWISHIEK